MPFPVGLWRRVVVPAPYNLVLLVKNTGVVLSPTENVIGPQSSLVAQFGGLKLTELLVQGLSQAFIQSGRANFRVSFDGHEYIFQYATVEDERTYRLLATESIA